MNARTITVGLLAAMLIWAPQARAHGGKEKPDAHADTHAAFTYLSWLSWGPPGKPVAKQSKRPGILVRLGLRKAKQAVQTKQQTGAEISDPISADERADFATLMSHAKLMQNDAMYAGLHIEVTPEVGIDALGHFHRLHPQTYSKDPTQHPLTPGALFGHSEATMRNRIHALAEQIRQGIRVKTVIAADPDYGSSDD
jgi:hypothetical protein